MQDRTRPRLTTLCKNAGLFKGRSKASRRRDTKNLLKQGNEVWSRPHSVSSTSSSRVNTSSSCSSSASSSSASSSSASNSSSSRLRRVSSSSALNTTSPKSSSTPGTSTSRTSSRSTSSTTSSSSNSSTSSSSVSTASSSGSSTPKACVPNKPLMQLRGTGSKEERRGRGRGRACGRGLWQGDTGPEVELMRSVSDRKRPQKMGSSRMDHGGTSDLHD
ncbi:unnamed protein product [Closterium sp. NIES-54]